MRGGEEDVLARFTEPKIPTKLKDTGSTRWCAVKSAESSAGYRQGKKAEQKANGCWDVVVKSKVRVRGVRVIAMNKVCVKGARCGPQPHRRCVWCKGHGMQRK